MGDRPEFSLHHEIKSCSLMPTDVVISQIADSRRLEYFVVAKPFRCGKTYGKSGVRILVPACILPKLRDRVSE